MRDRSRSRPRRALLALLGLLVGCTDAAPDGVVLIVVDTLRADRVAGSPHAARTAPYLGRWAGRGTLFEQAHATSPWTLPTVGSLLTGMLPSGHQAGQGGVDWERKTAARLREAVPTLAERLSGAGFATAAIVNNPWLEARFGLARGFAHYDAAPTTNGRHRPADHVLHLALATIDAFGEQPFFLWVHLFDPHMIYDAPPPYRGRFTSAVKGPWRLPVLDVDRLRAEAPRLREGERRFIGAAYDEEVAFVDRQLGEFFESLVARGRWRRLLVVLTADHGEELFDHDGFEHGHTVYQEQLHVPLAVWGPTVRRQRIATPVSLVDVAPTILDAVGLDPAGFGAGRSLWPTLLEGGEPAPQPLVAEGTLYGPERSALIEWPWKLERTGPDGARRLYDLAADPEERSDRAATESDVAARLDRTLRATLTAANPDTAPETVTLDEATRRALQALGYGN